MNHDDLAYAAACIDKERGIGGKFSIDKDHHRVTFLYSGCEYVFSYTSCEEVGTSEKNHMTVTKEGPPGIYLGLLWEIEKQNTTMRFRASLVFLEDTAGTYRLVPILTPSASGEQALAS